MFTGMYLNAFPDMAMTVDDVIAEGEKFVVHWTAVGKHKGELELLVLLVEKYEVERCPIDLPDPIAAVKFRMDQEGLEPKDMVAYLGSQSKVSEVLNYKRPLSLTMIRALNQGLGISAEVLLQDPVRMHREILP